MAKVPKDARDADGAKAPGRPGEAEGFDDPDDGECWSKNPNGRGHGWEDKDGNVWVPSGRGGRAHAGPHWDLQKTDGTHVNVYPGGKSR